MRWEIVLAAGLAAAAVGNGIAMAEPPTSPITTTDYAIELYDGVVYGNTAAVGMGGTTIALASGTAGTLFNPSAPAVRPSTDNDSWSWDYHLDYLNGSLSTDYDHNGFTYADGGASVFTLGLGGRVGDWAVAITGTSQTAPVAGVTPLPMGGEAELEAKTARVQFAVARWFPRIDTAIGLAGTVASFDFQPKCAGCEPLMSVSGGGIELGATWTPYLRDHRVGAAISSRILGTDLVGCDPSDCAGWTLPEGVVSPWRVATGAAYRFGPTAWNQQVKGFFRDERSLTVAADVILHGSSPNAYGLEAFGQHMLQRSGRHASISVRSGLEYEWLPGRLRVRAGSYWEPGRFVGVPGRLHLTFGLEVRVLHFWLWSKPRRGRISLTSDIAEQYRNGGLSVGFWH